MEKVTESEIDAYLAEATAKGMDVGEYALAEATAAAERVCSEPVRTNRIVRENRDRPKV